MPSIEAQIRACRQMKKAAMDLSAACIEDMRIPGQVSPLVKLYDDFLLSQKPSLEMVALLGQIK
jgi:hypothetical protein